MWILCSVANLALHRVCLELVPCLAFRLLLGLCAPPIMNKVVRKMEQYGNPG